MKAFEPYTYVTDQFKTDLDNINLEIAKQVDIQSKCPRYSKEYKESLQQEIEFLEAKAKFLDSASNSIKGK